MGEDGENALSSLYIVCIIIYCMYNIQPSAEKRMNHLTSNNSVHPNSVEVIQSDFHLRTENWAELDTRCISAL